MASFPEMMMKARKRSEEENEDTSTRFKEILDIVKAHDLKSGLTPEKAVALLQDLGTTFVKLGQIASTHPDVLPAEYCDAFGKLRTQARPLDFADVKARAGCSARRTRPCPTSPSWSTWLQRKTRPSCS